MCMYSLVLTSTLQAIKLWWWYVANVKILPSRKVRCWLVSVEAFPYRTCVLAIGVILTLLSSLARFTLFY